MWSNIFLLLYTIFYPFFSLTIENNILEQWNIFMNVGIMFLTSFLYSFSLCKKWLSLKVILKNAPKWEKQSLVAVTCDQGNYSARIEQGKEYLKTREQVRMLIFQSCNSCNCWLLVLYWRKFCVCLKYWLKDQKYEKNSVKNDLSLKFQWYNIWHMCVLWIYIIYRFIRSE